MSDDATEVVVRAAGGIVVRPGSDGPEVLVVHRPRYDDWSFPKGKRDPGETDEQTALREVLEETGLACRLGRELPEVRYRDHQDRPKVVRYWVMWPLDAHGQGTAFVPNDEADEAIWSPVGEAARLLTYEHDRALSRSLGTTDLEG